jgi:hypothetical protein
VQVQNQIEFRKKDVLDVVRDHLRRRAVRIAGKRAIEISIVEGRVSAPFQDRGKICPTEDRHAPAYVLGPQLASQFQQRDLAFVLVAVIAGYEQRSGARTILDIDDWNLNPAIGGLVR